MKQSEAEPVHLKMVHLHVCLGLQDLQHRLDRLDHRFGHVDQDVHGNLKEADRWLSIPPPYGERVLWPSPEQGSNSTNHLCVVQVECIFELLLATQQDL